MATEPLRPATTSLKLSKVPNAIMRTTPALGAFGLTYSKCLNPAGYLSSPNSDRPCRQSGGCAAAGVASSDIPKRSRMGDKAARAPVRTTDRRVRRKETSGAKQRQITDVSQLCPILDGPAPSGRRHTRDQAITL